MSSVTALTRSAAQALIDREERVSGSRMVAYVNVAAMVGVSAEWLRKFVKANASEAKMPNLETGFSILSMYDRVIMKIDDNTQKVANENAALREMIHAATPRSLSQHLAADSQIIPENKAFHRSRQK